MNYEKGYIRLWNAAEQAPENVDFERRFENSWAALAVLKNAVDWGRDCPEPNKPVELTAEVEPFLDVDLDALHPDTRKLIEE